MTAQGHPRAIFQRAIERGNLLVAENTLREIGRVTLTDALQLAALIAVKLELEEEAAWIDHRRAAAAWERGDIDDAIAMQERLLAFHQRRGDRLATADLLHSLDDARRDSGQFEQAEQDLLAAAAIFQSFGAEIAFANNSHSLADLALDRGDFSTAIDRYHATLAYDVDETGRLDAYCLAGIASAYAATGRDGRAAQLWGAVCSAEEELGFRMLTAERRRYEQRLARLEHHPAWQEGRKLTLEEARASLPHEPAPPMKCKDGT